MPKNPLRSATTVHDVPVAIRGAVPVDDEPTLPDAAAAEAAATAEAATATTTTATAETATATTTTTTAAKPATPRHILVAGYQARVADDIGGALHRLVGRSVLYSERLVTGPVVARVDDCVTVIVRPSRVDALVTDRSLANAVALLWQAVEQPYDRTPTYVAAPTGDVAGEAVLVKTRGVLSADVIATLVHLCRADPALVRYRPIEPNTSPAEVPALAVPSVSVAAPTGGAA